MYKHSRVWSLQEAKAKFSEVVRRAQSEGPQTVTVHGRDAVQIIPMPDASDWVGPAHLCRRYGSGLSGLPGARTLNSRRVRTCWTLPRRSICEWCG